MFETLRSFFQRLLGAPEQRQAPAVPVPTRKPDPAKRPEAKPKPAGIRPPRAVPKPRGRHLAYAPNLDGDADPGEIVWTWVPYEDDPSQGKDRPVLVVGRDANTLLGLMLSSQGERDGQRNWLALGPGDWDPDARPSWVRLDRVLEVDEDGIRREGAILDRPRFDRVAAILRRNYGWP
ncbi:type II toxin-antitoxin system PemK/MazF family toxin [Actinoplanes sp. NPDC023936]|uniref:type II toxin-antitoxin system PemK/MazF family toxin n=1 Tax=Actinoplanes sp. NPDC023936 TaxID=3154910 RepID=UPI0033F6F4CA